MKKLKCFLLIVAFFPGLLWAQGFEESKIEELKEALKNSKGEKRSAIIKQIAELENKKIEKAKQR